ncbi:MAG TPA: DNA gyrase modulator, partial [Terriglobia bacterium]|nr:DNA gyrase modulator [Terriglobia bacterium]
MRDTLKEIVQQVVDRARRSGATAADAFLREDETFSVTVRLGEVEKLKEAVSRNLRLRIFLGKRTATSQTSDLSSDRVGMLVDETLEMARLTSEDESGGLPEKSSYPSEVPDLALADPAWDDLT